MNFTKCRLLERFMYKVTSGRFIFTVVVAGVYALLAYNGTLDANFVREITLVVLVSYFQRDRGDDKKFLEGMEEDRKLMRKRAEAEIANATQNGNGNSNG
jgi:hypothetical protein